MKKSATLTKKSFLTLAGAVALATVAFSPSAHAQAVITWSAATPITSDSDVNTSGTFVSAFAFNSASSITVNGVTFAATQASEIDSATTFGSGAGNITLTPVNDALHSYAPGASFAGASANYNQLLGEDYYFGNGGAPTLALNGLTAGTTYNVQLFVVDQHNNDGRATTYSDGQSTPDTVSLSSALGEYTIGSFTATGTSETITASATNGFFSTGYFTAVDLTQAAATPEPSTYAMFLSGALLLGLVLRRRSTV